MNIAKTACEPTRAASFARHNASYCSLYNLPANSGLKLSRRGIGNPLSVNTSDFR